MLKQKQKQVVLLWFECQMFPTGLCIWIFIPQMFVLFGEAMEPLGLWFS